MKPKKCICGGNAYAIKSGFARPWQVVCCKCGKSSLDWDTPEEAIKNWNGGKGT